MEKEFDLIEKKLLKFKKAWAWPQKVEDYFKEMIKGKRSCHVFCGSSELGDVRVDIVGPNATHKEDILQGLSFEDESFDIVFGDPPWEMPYHKRHKIMYEMRRICKVNGLIILNCNWTPNNLKGCVLLQPILVSTSRMPWANAALIFKYIKIDKLAGEKFC